MRNLKGFSEAGRSSPAVLLAVEDIACAEAGAEGMDGACVDVCVDVCVSGAAAGTDKSRLAAVSGGRTAATAARGRGVAAATPVP